MRNLITYDPSEAALAMAMNEALLEVKALRNGDLKSDKQEQYNHLAGDLFTGGPRQKWTLRLD